MEPVVVLVAAAVPVTTTAPVVLRLPPVMLPVMLAPEEILEAKLIKAPDAPSVKVLPDRGLMAPFCSNIMSTEFVPSPMNTLVPGVPTLMFPVVLVMDRLLPVLSSICACVLPEFRNCTSPDAGVISTSLDI
jgi:hypothetical protein